MGDRGGKQPYKPDPLDILRRNKKFESSTKLSYSVQGTDRHEPAYKRRDHSREPLAHQNNRNSVPASSSTRLPPIDTMSPMEPQPMTTPSFSPPPVVQTYVGFANVPNQVYRRAVSRGFDFTLMVVGQSGLGKSTFLNTLFMTDKMCRTNKTDPIPATTKIAEHRVAVKENNVGLNLTLVDTPGFGDHVDNTNCWKPITDYIDAQCLQFYIEESKINRPPNIPDHRVHCVLYFIAPTGHGLKPLDIECLKQLHTRVNIIPVLAKADAFTPEECLAFKQSVMADLRRHEINIYQFPESNAMPVTTHSSSSSAHQLSAALKDLEMRVPFAVIGSNTTVDKGGRNVRARRYPWGVVEVESLAHNDYIALRDVLVRTHLVDMIDVTASVHYENYRAALLCPDGVRAPMTLTQLHREGVSLDGDEQADMARMESVLKEKVNKIKLTYEAKAMQQDREYAELLAKVAEVETHLTRRIAHYDNMCKEEPQVAACVKLHSSSSQSSIKMKSTSSLKRAALNAFNR